MRGGIFNMHMGINSGKNQNKETVLSLKKMLKKNPVDYIN